MTARSKLSMILALSGVIAFALLAAPGCNGGCVISGSNPDLSGMWHGGCGEDTTCQVVDDQGSLTVNCPGFGSCNGSACEGTASLDCTVSLDQTTLSGNLNVSPDGNMITGTLSGPDGPCNLIFQRMGGPGPH